MNEILFQLGIFTPMLDRAASERILRAALDLLLVADVEYLRAHPETPRIYKSGVRYQREPLVTEIKQMYPQCISPCQAPIHPETWQAIPYCLKSREADCEDLASWAAAERIVRDGIAANTAFSWREVQGPLGPMSVYHIFVRLPNGTVEDPSLKLGMSRS